jgi:hypothetical protein
MDKVLSVAEDVFLRDRFDRDIARSSRLYEDLESDVTATDDDADNETEEEDLREPRSNNRKTRRKSQYPSNDKDNQCWNRLFRTVTSHFTVTRHLVSIAKLLHVIGLFAIY